MAFPTLFPFSTGDATNNDRFKKVTMAQANAHLLNYAIKQPDNTLTFPFAKHSRWMHWAQNFAERHRHCGQCSVFAKKDDAGTMTIEELRRIVQEDGEELRSLMGRMQVYSANINGSAAYLFKNRKNLEHLMDTQGMCTMWFTLTAADNHWNDLHKLLRNSQQEQDGNKQDKARARRKLVRENPHIVDQFFQARAEAMLKTMFGKKGLAIEWSWYRVEYQRRRTAHVHGCFRLEGAPELTVLSNKVATGRIAQRHLTCSNQLNVLEEEEMFQAEEIAFDEWQEEEGENVQQQHFNEDQIEKMRAQVMEGKKAQTTILTFHDWIFNFKHPNPPPDANANQRNQQDNMQQNNNNEAHPSTKQLQHFPNEPEHQRTYQYYQIINKVQHHFCHPSYCRRRKKQGEDTVDCCFGFPKQARPNRTTIMITQKTTKDGTKRHFVDIVAKRNDSWLNSHLRPVTDIWLANTDFQLIVDVVKVIGYMTKYVTKADTQLSRGARKVFKEIVEMPNNNDQSIQTIIVRAMGKMLTKRTISRQETCHLINKAGIVKCSHSFNTIDLNNRSSLIVANQNQQDLHNQPQQATKMTTIDAYAVRCDPTKWKQDEYPGIVVLEEMNLRDFCCKFRVLGRGINANKIKPHEKWKKFVPVFYPTVSCDPTGPNFTAYCQHTLTKYKPWQNEVENAWGGANQTEAQIQAALIAFLCELLCSNAPPS